MEVKMSKIRAGTKLKTFIKIPDFIIQDGRLSNNDRILYGLLLDRTMYLSQSANWVDHDGYLYTFYTYDMAAANMSISQKSVGLCLNRLEEYGYILRRNNGIKRPTKIYPLIPSHIDKVDFTVDSKTILPPLHIIPDNNKINKGKFYLVEDDI